MKKSEFNRILCSYFQDEKERFITDILQIYEDPLL